ncbi:adhesion G-protein coupled receptor G6-like isoform X2 [Mercenaria mercenaria]|uniref:adhesion G-protein coupled receptor G6-like isoform X2 n=1 Tax=Mercenaria mercenaria TaxID=6596 RepID=UPI00234E483C|nr:adhesion G-protein coupled receptor G6-like isoform X2 [Mercenaria mercenaria]
MDQFKLRTLTFGFLFVCSFCAVTSQVDVCSSSFPGGALCNCTKTPSSLTYDCRARKIGYVPRGYKSTATTLNLSNNKIYNVYIGPLNNLRKLSILYLQANLIYQIEPGSFNGLMKLTQLILTSNQLTAIERGVFSHLPALEVLDLSNNKIKTINRYAFITLPSVYLINLESNQLTCGCEEYLLHEFFEIRKSSLTVQNKPCSTSTLQQPASTICTSGETLFVPSTSCYQCSNAVGVRDCRNQTVTNCSGPNSVCYNQMHYYYPGHLSVSGGCIDYTSCLYQEQRNRETCLNGTGTGTTCYFCNPDKLSNSRDETNTTRQFYVTLLVTLNQVMTSQLRDTNSAAYKSFTRNLENEVSNYIRNQKAAYRVNFVDLRSPDVTIAFRVLCATIWYNTKADVMDAIASALSRRTVNGVRVKTVQVFETSNTAPCPSETTESSTYGQFSWPTTKPGTVAFIQCPYQLSGAQTAKYASRICEKQADNSGLWKTPLLSDCPHADESSRELHNLAESDINNGNVEQVSSSLSNLTSNWEEFVSDDVIWSVRIIDGILKTDLSRASFDTITNTIETVNNLLFITPGILRQSEDESDSSNRLVNAVETLLDGVSVTNGDYKSVKDNIAGIVSGVSVSSFDGLAMSYINKGKQTLTETELAYTKAEGYTASGHSGIILPRSIFDSLTNRQKRSIDKMTMSVFRDPKLFSSITQSNETKLLPSDDGDVIPAERKINSNVIAANVPSVQIKDLSFPVVVTLHHFDAGENVSCVYWDVATKSWSADGCAVNQTTDDYTVCHCDHLTNFALLMDVYSTGGGLSKANSVALSIISYVGCGLSLLGVIITLLTYLKFRKLRRDNPSKILMNLCLSIGFVDIVFLIGVQEYSGKSDAGCKIVAILLHYFLLTAMCWMAVEAFYMYLALVKVFDTYVAHFQLKSALFGWGIPFVVVVVTLGINKTENYGLQPGGICWLDRVPFYAAFLGPVCLLLIVNTITYALVIRMIVKRSNKKLTKTDKSSTAVRLRGAISLVVLLGLTWAFAILAFDDFGIVFHYLFAVLNSLQGFFIFIFYCLMKKEAQQCWRKALPCLKSPYQKNISTNTQSKGDSSTFDSNKTTKMHLNTRDESNEDKKPTGNTGPNNTAFRGNWQVQVTTRSQPSSFV